MSRDVQIDKDVGSSSSQYCSSMIEFKKGVCVPKTILENRDELYSKVDVVILGVGIPSPSTLAHMT